MSRLFNPDSPVMQFLTRVADLVILNVLWLLFSLPVITLGASTTALYRSLLTLIDGGGTSTVLLFWNAFRSEFKTATLLFLILLLPFAVVFLDLWILLFGTLSMSPLMRGLCLLPVLLFFMAANYVYPLTAQFENTLKGTLKNAVLLALANLPTSFAVLVLSLLPLLVFLLATSFFLRSLIVWILLGFALIAQCNAYLLRRVFRKYFPPEESGEISEI